LIGIDQGISVRPEDARGGCPLNNLAPECLPLTRDSVSGWRPSFIPGAQQIEPWEYDRALYKKRNEIERLFRRLKGFCRIFSRFKKLDVLLLAFLNFALIVEALR
jgi:transposase